MAKLTSGTYIKPPRPTSAIAPGADAGWALEAGTMVAQIKQYQVLDLLGEGGMGWVYRAYDQVLDRPVALKVMKPDVPVREQLRFRREALLGAKLTHPGIARVYDLVGVPGQGLMWFVMEYLPGKDLDRVLEIARARSGRVPLARVLDALCAILRALDYAHEAGLVHRDVKPANMFATRDPNTGRVVYKLLDFGVALDTHEFNAETQQEVQVVGDPRFIAPEQSRLGQTVDGRADVYAMGMSLYELVSGTHPFADLPEQDARSLVRAQRECLVPSIALHLPEDFDPGLIAALDAIIKTACAKSPEDRFESAGAMASALERVRAVSEQAR